MDSRKFDIDLFVALNQEYADKRVAAPPSDPEALASRASKRADRLERLFDVRGKRVLELGCGRGELAAELARRGADVVAVDPEPYPEWTAAAHSNLTFLAADISGGHELPTSSFDVICSFSVMEHVRRPLEMLQVCRDLLSPTGRFLLVAHLYRSATGSHRSREVFFPWPHLLFTEDVFEEFYRRLGCPAMRPAWLNKLTHADYLRAFDALGLRVVKEFPRRRALDTAFYERFADELGRYPIADLTTNAVEVVLERRETAAAKKRPGRRSDSRLTPPPAPVHTGGPRREMANDDRVTELYRGEIFGREAQRVCRDRIHWMCSRIRGDRVLDIGCSQGIVTILAAREGRSVLGVDVEEKPLAFARQEVAKELPTVQERIRLVHGDIHELDLGGEVFDTVILGEILEHQTAPRKLFERACRFLAPHGVVIAATPFGLHVHDDHKTTFYLTSFLEVVEGLCTPESLDIVDGYIRFTARHRDAQVTSALPSTSALMSLAEKAFLEREWRAYETTTDRTTSVRKLSDEKQALTAKVAELEAHAAVLGDKLRTERAEREVLVRLAKSQADAQKHRAPARAGAGSRPKSHKGAHPHVAPAPDRGPVLRGLQTLGKSLQREIDSGRIRTEPLVALQKTWARVRRSVKGVAVPDNGKGQAAPHVETPVDARDLARRFPVFQPQVTPARTGPTIATILDAFSQHCLQYEASLVPLSLEGWKREMTEHRPALLFAESAWRGNDGQWKYLMTKYAQRESNPLRDLLAWCKENGIPRVFWNKEDPANFDVFKDVAADFDHVFTTDAECIPRYRALLGHERVYVLPFAAQPAIHSPMHDGLARDGTVCFAGSWRADKYPERAADTQMLLRPALDLGLEIFDRFQGTKDGERLGFPPPFEAAVLGALDYDRMLTAYRMYKVFLNVNSVRSSPTMFSRRVFELMACGTPVVSTDSVGIREMFGALVKVARTEDEARDHLRALLKDAEARNRFAHAGYREIMRAHTYAHRLQRVYEVLGLPVERPAPPRVSILAATNRPERLSNLLDNVRRQIHPAIELVILLNSSRYETGRVERAAADIEGVKVFSLPESFTLADCLNHGIEHCTGSWVAKFDDDDEYGPHYLSDLLLASQHTDAAVLGKRTYFAHLEGSDEMALRFPGHAHQHVHFVHGATLLIRRSVLDTVRFTPVQQGTDTIFLQACRDRGHRIYSADPYNFVHKRHADPGDHTWKISDQEFLKKCRVLRKGLDHGLVMI